MLQSFNIVRLQVNSADVLLVERRHECRMVLRVFEAERVADFVRGNGVEVDACYSLSICILSSI